MKKVTIIIFILIFIEIDEELINKLKKSLIIIFSLIGGDFLFCFITTILDVKEYKENKAGFFFLNFFIFVPLLVSIVILLLIKRKKQCIAAGIIYAVGGLLIWFYKLIYFIILLISEDLQDKYEDNYTESTYLICFFINLLAIFFRVGACYMIKKIYSDVSSLEDFLHEKEHAAFLQSLGTQNGGDDEEITEEALYKNDKNPFITGRKKKDEENEEEEINFQSTL